MSRGCASLRAFPLGHQEVNGDAGGGATPRGGAAGASGAPARGTSGGAAAGSGGDGMKRSFLQQAQLRSVCKKITNYIRVVDYIVLSTLHQAPPLSAPHTPPARMQTASHPRVAQHGRCSYTSPIPSHVNIPTAAASLRAVAHVVARRFAHHVPGSPSRVRR